MATKKTAKTPKATKKSTKTDKKTSTKKTAPKSQNKTTKETKTESEECLHCVFIEDILSKVLDTINAQVPLLNKNKVEQSFPGEILSTALCHALMTVASQEKVPTSVLMDMIADTMELHDIQFEEEEGLQHKKLLLHYLRSN